MSLPNPGMNFTPLDILPAADLNDIVENVEALAAGTGLDDEAVTAAKLLFGKLKNRRGGSATNWGTPGTNNYDISALDIAGQIGAVSIPNSAGADTAVAFPEAFSEVPAVFIITNTASGANQIAQANSVTVNGFNARSFNNGSGNETAVWIAFGPM